MIYFWARPHPASASCPNDPVGTVSGGSWAQVRQTHHPFVQTMTADNVLFLQDYLWAAVFATSSGGVTLTSGSNSQTFSVSTGVNKLQLSLSSGSISVSMSRNGAVLFSATPTDFTYTTSPSICKFTRSKLPPRSKDLSSYLDNYNAYVGSASKCLLCH